MFNQKIFRHNRFHLNCFRGNDVATKKKFDHEKFLNKNFFDQNCFIPTVSEEMILQQKMFGPKNLSTNIFHPNYPRK